MSDATRGFKPRQPQGATTSARRASSASTSLVASPCRIVNPRLQGSAQIATRPRGTRRTRSRDWRPHPTRVAPDRRCEARSELSERAVLQAYKERVIRPVLQGSVLGQEVGA